MKGKQSKWLASASTGLLLLVVSQTGCALDFGSVLKSGSEMTSVSSEQSSGLLGNVMSSLGVNSKQAAGGTGALLNYAKGQLGGESFSTVSSAVPALAGLMGGNATKALGGGMMAGMATNVATSVMSMDGVQKTFSSLGMDPGMVQQFIPLIVSYASSQGGDTVGNLLAGAFK